ncbi:MAG TPA: hypothetical protein G4O15_12780 [Dehalococcoidia bacterium]|nr:hypothetical protein [Dehalococcoidia bacterium]
MPNVKDNLSVKGQNEIEEDIDNIEICFDEESLDYCAVINLIVVGLGKTIETTLEDLREAGYFGIDTMINTKLNCTNHQMKTTGLR